MSLSKVLPIDELPSENIAIVVAHPDDEAIGFASVLHQFPQCLMVHVTDGTPQDEKEWKGRRKEDYARVRQAELRLALDTAAHGGARVTLDVPDQEAAFHLSAIAGKLADLFSMHGTRAVFTHAYEGGHPDHDAVALVVHAALSDRLLIEAPFYHPVDGELRWQQFLPHMGTDEVCVRLPEPVRSIKRVMLAAHASQGGACNNVSDSLERFRVAPRYDFTRPANHGILWRTYASAGIDADLWQRLVCTA